MSLREYVVTLHNFEDLENFYLDMETEGGALYVPNRIISVQERQPTSRNTTYLLTDEEAEQVRNDPRVMAVELSIKEQNLVFRPLYTQYSSTWNKSNTISNTHVNWGLLRCVEGETRPNWGSNGTTNVSGSINVTASGKYVDVVIIDGHFNPSHPEFAVNADGSGGTRVVQYNWFDLNPIVIQSPVSTYVYTPYIDNSYGDFNNDGFPDRTYDNDHGCHVAGIAAGNSQGWARDASIYNINPYSTNPSYTSYFLQYVKVWHQTKQINPITGIKNPTVVNMSIGLTTSVNITTITRVVYQGTQYVGNFTSVQLTNFGIYNDGNFAYTMVRNASIEQDITDLMNAGAIVVGAAGNTYSKIANYSATASNDYNNYFRANNIDYYYMRGTVTAVTNALLVGAIDSTVVEYKTNFSNCGPRVDVYAPGRRIISSVNSTVDTYVTDNRNGSFVLGKRSGTSQACPQVTGIVACLAENWPTMKQTDAVTHITNYAKVSQITDTGGGPSDYTSLQGSTNRYLYFYPKRPTQGQLGPVSNYGNRPTKGQVYPRARIFRYGKS